MKPFPKGPALAHVIFISPCDCFFTVALLFSTRNHIEIAFFHPISTTLRLPDFLWRNKAPLTHFPGLGRRPPTRQGSKGECEVEGGSESEHEGRKYAYVFTRCAPGDRRRGLFALRRQKIASRHRRKTTHSAWDSICFHRHRGGFSCAMFRAGCDAISNDITNERWARFCQTTDKAKG